MPNQEVPALPPPAQGLIETAVQLTLIANGVITPQTTPMQISGTMTSTLPGNLANAQNLIYLPVIGNDTGETSPVNTNQNNPTSTPLGPTQTPTETFTATPIPPTATPITPTPLPCLSAKFLQDINVPPGTVFPGGTKFTKIWRVQNTGSCAWNRNFTLMWVSGDMLGAKNQVPIPGVVQPGDIVDLQIDLVAPKTDGKYKGAWMLNDNAGHVFGVGKNATDYLWVEIRVKNSSTAAAKSPTSTPKPANTSAPTQTKAPTSTKTFTPTVTPITPSPTPTPTETTASP
ncbi:MAG: NBR1-Ig-like domain-containing protein [Anaerolineales bacterium]